MAADICISIHKFSQATDTHSKGPVSWSHLTSADLYLTIKGDGAANIKLRMCIVERNNVLESLHLGSYIDAAIEARRRAEETAVDLLPEQLPIFGMTKDALLALRYNTPQSKVRRLQLRMRTVDDCQLVLGVLMRRGLEVQHHRLRTARPDTGTSEHRLLTGQADSPYFAPDRTKSRPAAFHLSPVEAGSLSHPLPASPERPNDQGTVNGTNPRQDVSHLRREPITRDQYLSPCERQPARPKTPTFYQSMTVSPTNQTPGIPSDRQGEERSFIPAGKNNNSGSPGPNLEPNMPRTHVESTPTSDRGFPIPISMHSGDIASPVRPMPSTSLLFPDTLANEIPPRRELPFKRPESYRSRSDRGSSRPSSALELPPLPKPNMQQSCPKVPTRTSASHSSEGKAAVRPRTVSPGKSSWTPSEQSTNTMAGTTKAAVVSSGDPPNPITRAGATVLSPMEELLSRQRPITHQTSESKVSRLSSLLDAPHEVESLSSAARTSLGPPHLQGTPDSTIGAVASAGTGLGCAGASQLSTYAAQTHEDRAAALDEFMASKLEDPSFTVLCRDVENCWRRIALGL